MSQDNIPSKKRVKQLRGDPLPTRVVGPCQDTQGADVAEAVGLVKRGITDAMVDRFLSWPLPKSVCSDTCVSDREYKFPRYGTSLLTADEARAMLEHVWRASEEEKPAPETGDDLTVTALRRTLNRHVRWRERAMEILRQVERGYEGEWPEIAAFIKESDSRVEAALRVRRPELKALPVGHHCGNCGADLSNHPTSASAHTCPPSNGGEG